MWIKLSDSNFSDELIKYLLEMPHLSKLYLDNTWITDQSLSQLTQLKSLRYLNIVGTHTTEKGISSLRDLPNLERLFIYQTRSSSAERMQLLKMLAPIQVDTGGYVVPTLATDTTFVSGK